MELDWKHIIHLYQEPIYWHIRRMVVCHEDARDLLQEVFLQAFNSAGQLRDRKAVKAWLYKIATNKCLRYLEKLSEDIPLDEVPATMMGRLFDSDYVDLENAAGLRFQQALQTLSPQQKAVFTLRYYDDLNYDEISQITGWKVDVLKASYHQAKKKVKTCLLQEHI